MNFSDRAIIISKKPLQERSYIITVFTESHGIYSGVLKQYSKKMGDSLIEGNLIDFSWNARLHEHLGYVKAELIKAYNGHFMMNKTKLYAFSSIISLLKIAFCEREPHNNLFPSLLRFLESLKQQFSFREYIKLELAILAESGYKLQLDRCAATNSAEELYYVSPKSGKAVSKEAGAEYSSKLLKLPQFLLSNLEPTKDEISEAFALTFYFLERYIFVNRPEPDERQSLRETITYEV